MSQGTTGGSLFIGLIDHTCLNDTDTQDSVTSFVQSMLDGGHPLPAGVCVFPKFVKTVVDLKLAKSELYNVRIAGTANFPLGRSNVSDVLEEVKKEIADGVEEIDVVIDYKKIHEDPVKGVQEATQLVKSVKALGLPQFVLKVILETGELKDPELIRKASRAALEGGADMLKTSTGKVPVNATPEAVRIMAQEIAKYQNETGKKVGLKVAGGVKSLSDCETYLNIVKEELDETWIHPKFFRFGASSLLKVLRTGSGPASEY